MSRKAEIQNAYKYLGKEATFYDGMITCSTIPGKAVCKAVWNMGVEENTLYLELAMAGIPESFDGKMLEVPVGTGVLTIPVYKTIPDADMQTVGQYFSVEDEQHLAAWSDDFASVVRKGYMTGYRKLDRRYGVLANALFRIVDKSRTCQIIEIDFR